MRSVECSLSCLSCPKSGASLQVRWAVARPASEASLPVWVRKLLAKEACAHAPLPGVPRTPVASASLQAPPHAAVPQESFAVAGLQIPPMAEVTGFPRRRAVRRLAFSVDTPLSPGVAERQREF
jgi:hypothetical protein